MRSVLVLCLLPCLVLSQDINDMKNMPKYDTRYDYLDLDSILDNKRLVRNYVDCLINLKPCSPEGKALKRILPEALRTKCVRCTEKQQRAAVKVIRRLKSEYPEEWGKLSSRWDPTGDFTRYFEEFLAKEQFNSISPEKGSTESRPPRPYPPQVSTAPAPAPAEPTTAAAFTPTAAAMPAESTTPRPIILNRFGDDGELMTGQTSSTPPPPAPPTARPRPMTEMKWSGAGSEAMPSRFPSRPPSDASPPYTTAMTLIDQIGIKIIRTTELVTDILRNTVRAVVG